MFRCEACGEDMGKVMSQCPRCSSWQVGAVAHRHSSPNPRQTAQAASKPRKVRDTPGAAERSTENQRWARATLDSLGFLWGSDVDGQLQPAVTERSAELVPRHGARWLWHGGSSAIFVFSILFSSFGLDAVAAGFTFFWSMSVAGHAWMAVKGYNARTLAVTKQEQELWQVVRAELSKERLNLLRGGPFGPSQSRPPSREPNGLQARDAEHLCATWLAYLGEEHVKVTRATGDGGVDITSARCVAQVKNYQGSVGVVPVRELVGVASVDGRFPVFFTSGQYTRAALQFAEDASVYLFRYDAEAGTLDAKSSMARKALSAN